MVLHKFSGCWGRVVIVTVVVHKHEGAQAAGPSATHDDGVDCPECAGFVQIYKLRVTPAMARDLLLCHERNGTQSFFLPVMTESLSAEFLKLRHWGFIAQCADSEHCWYVTELGERWLLGTSDAPQCALFYNGCLVKMTEADRMTVTDVLGRSFASAPSESARD